MAKSRTVARRVGIAFGVFVMACIAGGAVAEWRYGSGNFLVLMLAAIIGAGAYFEVRRRDQSIGPINPGTPPPPDTLRHGLRTVAISAMWVVLAFSVLLLAFGASWWVSIPAFILAWSTWLVRSAPVSMASAAVAIGLTLYWLALIPSTAGSELVLVLLALESAVIAMLSARRVAELRARRVPT
jgi:hypothetical protein